MTDEEKAELAAIEAELAAVEESRAAAAEPTAEQRIAAKRRELADAKAIKAAEDEHGAECVAVVETRLGAVVVRTPAHMQYRRFISVDKPNADHVVQLVHSCLVYPDRAAFQALTEALPAVPMLAASAAVGLAQGKREDVRGKS